LKQAMNPLLTKIEKVVYDTAGLHVSNYTTEPESKEYCACRFTVNGLNVHSRNAKITPKKAGQFVTFWKRSSKGPIAPFHESDAIDFFLVNVQTEDGVGQFVFPKSVLVKKGLISTDSKEGKRAFRVYPRGTITTSKQAQQTQKWQLDYYYIIDSLTDLKTVAELFGLG